MFQSIHILKNKFSASLGKAPAIVALTLGLFLVSCGGKKADESMVAPQGMHVLDLSRYGKPFAIFVPDTVSAKLQVTEQSSGALEIKVGKNFAVSINEQFADLNLLKTDIKEDEVNKLKSFVVDEPAAIFWESAWGDDNAEPQFHFVVNQKIGNGEYSFEDIRDPEVRSFGKDAIQKMFDSCKSIKEVKQENKS